MLKLPSSAPLPESQPPRFSLFKFKPIAQLILQLAIEWEEVAVNSSLDDFFEFFAKVSRTELPTMPKLTFQLNFEGSLSFTIPRPSGRIVWDKMKNTVAGVFSGWKRKNSKVWEFSITVEANSPK
jgi:hypothetical protein